MTIHAVLFDADRFRKVSGLLGADYGARAAGSCALGRRKLSGGALSAAFGAVPDAEGRAIAGTDHAFILQKPGQVAAAIADFIARRPM